jgi:hypothetical protein
MDEDILTSPIRLYSLATAAAENMRLSASLTKLDTMVAMARELNDVDLESISFLKLPVYDLEGEAVGRLGLAEGAEDIFSAIRDEGELLVEDGKLISPDSIKEPNINPETGETTPAPTTTTNVDGVTAADELCSN